MKNWTEREITALAEQYLLLLRHELAQKPLAKTPIRRSLAEELGRSEGSIEYKFANASAVLRDLGYPYVEGYKPRPNYQRAMLPILRQMMETSGIGKQATTPSHVTI